MKTTKITFSALALSLTIMGIQPTNILANDDITEKDVNIETQTEVETPVTEEDIKKEVDQIVDTTKENYDTTVQEVNTDLENRQEEIDTTKENIETTNTEINEATEEKTEIETTTNDTLEETKDKTEEVVNQTDSTYDAMDAISEEGPVFWEDHDYDNSTDETNEVLDEIWDKETTQLDTMADITAIYDQAPIDYEKLYNATIQYGKDYDEDAYNKAIEGIVIPEYDFNKTYEATDNLIEALKPLTDNSATEYIKVLEQYKVSVKELADLNYAQTFKDLYTLKGEYDKVRALEQAIAQKEAEVKELEANLEKQEAEYVQAKADGDEKIAEALDAWDKAKDVQDKTNQGIYEIVPNDSLYDQFNKLVVDYTTQNNKPSNPSDNNNNNNKPNNPDNSKPSDPSDDVNNNNNPNTPDTNRPSDDVNNNDSADKPNGDHDITDEEVIDNNNTDQPTKPAEDVVVKPDTNSNTTKPVVYTTTTTTPTFTTKSTSPNTATDGKVVEQGGYGVLMLASASAFLGAIRQIKKNKE